MSLLDGTTADYVCYICRQSHENLVTLHRHNVSAHTSEELSFAIIALNGWAFTSNDINVFESSVDSAVCDGISEVNDSTVAETVKHSNDCLRDISLTATAIADDVPDSVVPFYKHNSSFKLADIPLDVNVLHNSGTVSERSVMPVENAESLYDLNSVNVPVVEQARENPAKSSINAQCDHSTSAISSDDLSGSETETDIEVNGSGRLFDSDYDIKIDIFDEYDDLEIEEGNKQLSPNRNENNVNYLTDTQNISLECSRHSLLIVTSPQKNVVKEECVNKSNASVTGDLNSTNKSKIMLHTRDKNCPLSCTDKLSHRNNQSAVSDTKKVNDEHRDIVPSNDCVAEFSKPLSCSTVYSNSSESVNTVDSGHDVFVPVVENGNEHYRQGNLPTTVTKMSTVDTLSSRQRLSSPSGKTSEKEEPLENSKIYCAVKSVCNSVAKLKVEKVNQNGSTFCTSSSEIISSQVKRKDAVPVYRCAITCVARSGGFFKAKVDPGPLKDATISKVAERRFFCESCGKGYKKKSHLERHLRAHTGERPFQCSYCTKRFAVRSILKQHLRIHTGEKPYCCSVCLQRFPQKSGLMTHMMLHTGKPFKCDLCEKSFVSNHKLLQHLKSHESQNIYSCSDCKTKFFTEGALREHGKIHSEAKLECSAWQVDFL